MRPPATASPSNTRFPTIWKALIELRANITGGSLVAVGLVLGGSTMLTSCPARAKAEELPAPNDQAAPHKVPDHQPRDRVNHWLQAQSDRDVPRNEIPEGLQRLATAVILDNLPERYTDDDDWGSTRERWDGLHMRLDGIEVRTKRRWKEVNHGTWKRVEITQIDPQQNFQVRLSAPRTLADGRTAFDIVLTSKMNAVARLIEWNRGVRLLSVTLDADADVEIIVHCCLDVHLDATRFPPDLVLKPEVTDAKIHLKDLRINRISHFDGPVVRELSSGLKRVLREKIDEKRPKIVSRINRQIERHSDDLRLSLADAWRERWSLPAASEAKEMPAAATESPSANLPGFSVR